MGQTVSAENQTLRRQALEPLHAQVRRRIDSVVVFMPPEAKSQSTVFLRRSDVADELDRPLSSLLPTTRPTVGGLNSLEEGQILRLTRTRTYTAEGAASPDGSPVLILTPPAKTPDPHTLTSPRAAQGSSRVRAAASAARSRHGWRRTATPSSPSTCGPIRTGRASRSRPISPRRPQPRRRGRSARPPRRARRRRRLRRASSTSHRSTSFEERWDALLAVLLTSPFLLARYAWQALRESGDGRFLAVASVHGLVASPYKAGYVAAKHGLLGLVKVLALEGAEHGISAAAICPGYVRTPIVESQIDAQSRATGIPPSASSRTSCSPRRR